jgi:hypothetical protein
VDERPERHAISDGTAQDGVKPDGTVRSVLKAACLEAYEMLEEIALRRGGIPLKHLAGAEEAWRRITAYLADEEQGGL